LDAFRTRYDGGGTALELVKMIIETFPPFRLPSRGRMRQVKPFLEPRADSPRRAAHARRVLACARFPSWNCTLPSRRRTWPHSLLLGGVDVLIRQCSWTTASGRCCTTRVLRHPPVLSDLLCAHTEILPGAREEVSICGGSVLAVEHLRIATTVRLVGDGGGGGSGRGGGHHSPARPDLWQLPKAHDVARSRSLEARPSRPNAARASHAQLLVLSAAGRAWVDDLQLGLVGGIILAV
jgi:hypothetical protein